MGEVRAGRALQLSRCDVPDGIRREQPEQFDGRRRRARFTSSPATGCRRCRATRSGCAPTGSTDRSRSAPRWSPSTSQYSRGNENNADPAGKVPGYAIVALDASWNIAPEWQLFARIDNLFNRTYPEFRHPRLQLFSRTRQHVRCRPRRAGGVSLAGRTVRRMDRNPISARPRRGEPLSFGGSVPIAPPALPVHSSRRRLLQGLAALGPGRGHASGASRVRSRLRVRRDSFCRTGDGRARRLYVPGDDGLPRPPRAARASADAHGGPTGGVPSALTPVHWAFAARHRGRRYVNPTLVLQRGERARDRWSTRWSEPTIIHWHGLAVDTRNDGNGSILVRARRDATTTTSRSAIARGMYWYHPHPHGRTAAQTYRGLFGSSWSRTTKSGRCAQRST